MVNTGDRILLGFTITVFEQISSTYALFFRLLAYIACFVTDSIRGMLPDLHERTLPRKRATLAEI